jgi:RHS repeat-associated protein
MERYYYSAYGEREVEVVGGAVPGQDIGFTGRRFDEETGLWYFRARYYDGELGRFIGRDPLGYVDGMSMYGAYFVPKGTDPYGYFECPSSSCSDGSPDVYSETVYENEQIHWKAISIQGTVPIKYPGSKAIGRVTGLASKFKEWWYYISREAHFFYCYCEDGCWQGPVEQIDLEETPLTNTHVIVLPKEKDDGKPANHRHNVDKNHGKNFSEVGQKGI